MKELYYQMKKSVDLSKLPKIEGYDFNKEFNFQNFIKSFSTTGIQAANLGTAIEITKTMIREEVPIYLSFTSNMISSGMREIIAYLVQHNKIAVLCTAAGGVEEDAIKAHTPFRVGSFDSYGSNLFEAGIGRIGNIYATNEHYTHFEFFIREVFEELMKENPIMTPSDIARMMGKLIGEKKEYSEQKSYLYWAYKNNK